MDDRIIKLETPERIRFRYTLALPGTRAAALIIDLLIQGIFLLLWGLLGLLLTGAFMFSDQGNDSAQGSQWLVAAFLTLLWFFMQWGYFSLFEIINNGRTPGKKAMKISVIHESGKALDIPSVLLRNFLRIVDGFPVFYGVGALFCHFDKKGRRLGDILGSTLVVVDERTSFKAPDFSFSRLEKLVMDKESLRITQDLKSRQAYLNENQLYLIRSYLQGIEKSPLAQNSKKEEKLVQLVSEQTGVTRGDLTCLGYLLRIYKGHCIFGNP